MKNCNYEVNIDTALLTENLNFTQFLNNNVLSHDAFRNDIFGNETLIISRPSAGTATQAPEYSVGYLKDKSAVDRIINAFTDVYKEKLHVTFISTDDLMVVKLTP